MYINIVILSCFSLPCCFPTCQSTDQALNAMEVLTRTLPASWFYSEPLYQLERRAVFFKVGIYLNSSFIVADFISPGTY